MNKDKVYVEILESIGKLSNRVFNSDFNFKSSFINTKMLEKDVKRIISKRLKGYDDFYTIKVVVTDTNFNIEIVHADKLLDLDELIEKYINYLDYLEELKLLELE